jgi:hypothetical protein
VDQQHVERIAVLRLGRGDEASIVGVGETGEREHPEFGIESLQVLPRGVSTTA